MKLFLAFSGEGPTDNRFFIVLIERLINIYFLEKGITAELSWTNIRKGGTSKENILRACEEAKDQNIVFFHRDGEVGWDTAFKHHFQSALEVIKADRKKIFNKNLVPVIPVQELEAWMLSNKKVLIDCLETKLSENDLGLDYKISRIEQIADPKSKISFAVTKVHQSIPKKKRKYAIKIGDLYDVVATEVPLRDLENLDSFNRFQSDLFRTLDSILQTK